jgi:hypothetical protein
MKTNMFRAKFPKFAVLAIAVTSLICLALPGAAQDATSAQAQAPALPYGVSQVLQLQQAKVGDDTIITYIKNSGTSYGLNADQIIYLREQGLSSAVLNAMLSQPAPGAIANASPNQSTQAPAAPASYSSTTQPAPPSSSSMIGPSVTAIDPTAAAAANTTYYYYQPYPYTYYPAYSYPYYYPAYGYFRPSVSFSIGWGGSWGGWRGGGWHGGGWGGHGGWHH